MTQSLPAPFAALDQFIDKWDHPNTNGRYAARLASSMNELRAFREAMQPHLEPIKTYLDARAIDKYSEPEKALARLMFAYSIVAVGVEIYKAPAVPDTAAASLFFVTETEL